MGKICYNQNCKGDRFEYCFDSPIEFCPYCGKILDERITWENVKKRMVNHATNV